MNSCKQWLCFEDNSACDHFIGTCFLCPEWGKFG